ncbi:patatin-like phospholipase family protein [Promineifilum sp.]|uniref:patatin-like phospholipase family protein n=1 Tax=Promineifilum sp. TaxID=2664178 RepID=UPI0035B4736E
MLAFVLSGGGSRGALQVGALQALLEAGIKPDMIVGTSIGAINAAWLASNPTLEGVEELKKLYATVVADDLFPGGNKVAALSLVLRLPSLFANVGVKSVLDHYLPVERFGDLTLPCYVVATDMDTGVNHVFGDNPDDRLVDGLMSSTAMAPLHPSWEVNGHTYADGGLGAMLPVMEAVERGATEIIGLNLASQFQTPDKRNSALDTMVHVVDLLLHSQVKSQIETVVRTDGVAIEVINLDSEQYQDMRYIDTVQEGIQYGYNFMCQYLSERKRRGEVLGKRRVRRARLGNGVEGLNGNSDAIVAYGTARSRYTRQLRRSAALYGQLAGAMVKSGPQMLAQLPLALPGTRLALRTGLVTTRLTTRAVTRCAELLPTCGLSRRYRGNARVESVS